MPASTLVEDHTKAVETKDAKTANDAMEVELMEVPSLGSWVRSCSWPHQSQFILFEKLAS